ncbi:MAG: MBL fold metallo-hydrolase [Candidatus Aminicenantes bacterium]
MRIKFLGAAQQVTGSSYLLETGGLRIIVDCGLYQEREYLSRNWDSFPVPAADIDHIILTHVHLDHCGLVPKLVKDGFSGQILTTAASDEMLEIVLLDSAEIQEEDAAYKRKRHKREKRRGPYPVKPLYTVKDAKKTLPLVKNVPYNALYPLNEKVMVRLHDAGHILGAAMVEVIIDEESRRRIIFSGDIGQWDKPLVRDPSVFAQADYVVMESTYGDRNHEDYGCAEGLLREAIIETVNAGGNLLIPTFAIERAQEVMYCLSRLARKDQIPYLMMFLDSPMAVDITSVFERYKTFLDDEARSLFERGESPFSFPGLRLVHSVAQSKAINSIRGSCVIMAGSGMCTGGRIKHHLVQNIHRKESTVLFVGYQAHGTLGRLILDGRPEVRIHGQMYPVKAKIRQIQGFSAHADRNALLKWVGSFKSSPKRLFITHGEKRAAFSLAEGIKVKFDWPVSVPEYLEDWELD